MSDDTLPGMDPIDDVEPAEEETEELSAIEKALLPSKKAKAEAELVDKTAEAIAHSLRINGAMEKGDIKFGITCTGTPIMDGHWLTDSSVCGDMVMALPSSVLVAGRGAQGGVAVDMFLFLDAIIEGAATFTAVDGVAQAASLPRWAVSRMMGSFPALGAVYNEAMDEAVLTIEAAAYKASTFRTSTNTRKMIKSKAGKPTEVHRETLTKEVGPDAALSKMILASRMKSKYKDEGDVQQAVVLNLFGAEADL